MSGYSKLARFIGQYPEYAIHPRFAAENEKRLLFKQAEISRLSCQLNLIFEDDQTMLGREDFEKSYFELRDATCDDGAALQYHKAEELFDKMDEYYDMLLQTERVMQLSKPRASSLNFLRYWLDWERGGNFFLQGIEAEPYKEENTKDLLTLSSSAARDPFAQYLSDKLLPGYHRLVSNHTKPSSDDDLGKLWNYNSKVFVVLGDIICAVLSALIPVMAIFLLYFLHSMLKRLLAVTGMSFLFSFLMAVVGRGRRVDVFASTMAFAAVQVVFVGSVNVPKNH